MPTFKVVWETKQIKSVMVAAKDEDEALKIAESLPEKDFDLKDEVLEPSAYNMN
jgi:hypothetical protein